MLEGKLIMFTKYTPDEILRALQIIKDVCTEYEDCSHLCPLYKSGCKLREDIPPDQWRLSCVYTGWKAFE